MALMRIHCLQHVPFEDPGAVGAWAASKGHPLTVTALFRGDPLPPVADLDLLVVLGGPMNVYEEEDYPWLRAEKRLIGEAVDGGKKVLGICLGAQLMAEVLGAAVTRMREKEIGWFPVELTEDGLRADLFASLPRRFTAFHWHGDTFSLPPKSVRVAGSEACENQAFLYGDRVVGLQFHLESTRESVIRLVEHCGADLADGPYVQRPEAMLLPAHRFLEVNGLMSAILDRMERR